MDAVEIARLVNTLKEENKNNSIEDREFNNEWIRLIYISWGNALNKTYRINKPKPDQSTIKDNHATNYSK